MIAAVLIGVVGVVLIALVGALVALRPVMKHRAAGPFRHPWAVEGARRLRRTQDHLVAELGRLGAYAVVVAAGTGMIVAVGWPLGRLAHRLENSVDWPVFRWFQDRQVAGWTDAMNVLTHMGNLDETKIIAVSGVAVLTLVAHRRRLVPLLVIGTLIVGEFYLQQWLGTVVDRGHPPTTLGTWPSGGCARLLALYGLLFYLFLRYRQPARRTVIAGWTLLAILAYIEGYTRTYLLKHWVTDVLGGWIFGAILLLIMIVATDTLDRPRRREAADVPPVGKGGNPRVLVDK